MHQAVAGELPDSNKALHTPDSCRSVLARPAELPLPSNFTPLPQAEVAEVGTKLYLRGCLSCSELPGHEEALVMLQYVGHVL